MATLTRKYKDYLVSRLWNAKREIAEIKRALERADAAILEVSKVLEESVKREESNG